MPAPRALAGFHAVTARLRAAPESIEVIHFDPRRRDARMQQLQQLAHERGIALRPADSEQLRDLSRGAAHQGVVALAAEIAQVLTLDDLLVTPHAATLLLALDGVTDPRNLGACLRVADAAGVDAVIVPKDRSAGLTTAGLKAASGAAETVPLVEVTNLARALSEIGEAGIHTVGAAGNAMVTIYEVELLRPVCWVLGAEGSGLRRLSKEKCDELARIPLRGHVESLNVSVAAGICLFETVRQRSILPPDVTHPA